jgi:hypothetical protein
MKTLRVFAPGRAVRRKGVLCLPCRCSFGQNGERLYEGMKTLRVFAPGRAPSGLNKHFRLCLFLVYVSPVDWDYQYFMEANMKRFVLFSVWGLLVITHTFAEDAKALSAKSGAYYTAPGVSFFSKAWDGDGEKTDVDKTEVFYFGFGLDYGFANWFSAAFDWKGWDIWSNGDGPPEQYEGFKDFSMETRFRLIGDKAPVKTAHFRLTVAPGVIFPFPLIDKEDKMDKNAWGFGGSLSFDTDVNKNFFLNFFGTFYFYPIENEEKTRHGWELTLEAEPNFNIGIPFGMNLAIGLPVHFDLGPEQEIDGVGNGRDYYALSLRPTATLRMTHGAVPVEVGINYAIPLAGKNTLANHAITVKTSIFF